MAHIKVYGSKIRWTERGFSNGHLAECISEVGPMTLNMESEIWFSNKVMSIKDSSKMIKEKVTATTSGQTIDDLKAGGTIISSTA